MHELLRLTLVELCDALHARRASPVDLMQAVLGRIETANPDLNAVVVRRDPEAVLPTRVRPSSGSPAARGGRSRASPSA